MNISLCGMMGVGKTTVGRQVAAQLNCRWFDTDDVIIARYGSISDLFAQKGGAYFRALETETVRELTEEDGLVLSLGGGLVLREENVALLKKNGMILYLKASEETILSRAAANDNRPLLKGDAAERIHALLAVRDPIYTACADVIVRVDGKSVREVREEVVKRIKERAQSV